MNDPTTNSSGYTLTIKVANSFVGNGAIPHAFVTISGPDLAPVSVGYYPQLTGISGLGTVRNDAISYKGFEGMDAHPYDQSLTFQISPQQALNALNFAASTANDPGQYQLLGASDKNNLLMQDGYQCTGFARDMARAAGITPQSVNTGTDETIYPSTLGGIGVSSNPTNIASYPASLMREFGGLDSNQVQPFRSAPDPQSFTQVRRNLYRGISAHDPVDQSGVDGRIKPVGEVAFAVDNDTSISAPTSEKTTVFNPANALPSYKGDNAVTVQPGDTVSSIAKRYDMTVGEFSAYLKAQFGDSADLNSIVAGHKLPIPQAVYERTLGGVNGLDLNIETPRLAPEVQEMNDALVDAFSNPQTPLTKGVLIADNSGVLPEDAVDQNAGTQLQDLNQGIGLFNGLSNLQNWDYLSDVGKFQAVMGFYNSVDGLGAAFGGSGNNLPGDFAETAGWLNLAQGVQSGDALIIASGINHLSDQAVDEALNSMLGSSEVPYVSALIALNNLEVNPVQSISTLAGMYLAGPLGGAIGGFVAGTFGSLFSGGEPPPFPEGAVHFIWDANGKIQHSIDYNQSGGGDVANNLAAGVQGLLEAMVQAINEKNSSSADDVAINPYLIPRIGYSSQAYGAWLEVTMNDGTTFHEPIFSSSIAQKLIEILISNGGLAPAWQVQTLQERVQHLKDTGASNEQIERELHAGLGGLSSDNTQAFALQGNATQSQDFKSQTLGALVVHLGDTPGVQAAQTQLIQVLRDADDDGYFEQTQTVAARDSAGDLQALLTIDFNGDRIIQTRDILNLGGNTSEGSPTDKARLANANADLQRNNIEWLDTNGDGKVDKSDPAFAAIKLWVDINQDGVQSGNEVSSLDSQRISSIDFKTGQVTYADGHTDALTAQTLKADTEGIKLTQIREVNPDGTLRTLDAGTVLEHEGYQGQVQISDEGGTRWVDKRDQTYEQQALRTGDWEGTAEQEAHRQGGGNVEGASTQTTATGATNFGPVKTAANQTTQSTITAGDARVVSDAPTQAPVKPNAQVTFVAGDSRIKSDAVPTPSPAVNSIRVPETRLAIVPSTQASSTNEIRLVTQDMIESAGSSMFGAAGLGVLGAVGLGATASAAEAAAVQANVVSAGSNANPSSSNSANAVSTNNRFTSTLPNSGVTPNTPLNTQSTSAEVVVKQAEVLSAPVSLVQGVQTVQTAATSTTASSNASPVFVSSTPASPVAEVAPVVLVKAVVISSTTSSKASSDRTPVANSAPGAATTSTDATFTTYSASGSVPTYVTMDYPVVIGETLPGTEDVVLRLSQDVLLANDSSPNARADANAPALTITAVADGVNGQVSLNDGVVVFMPNTNFHGEASFTYTVTDQYGLSTTGSTTWVIAAVNDAPVTQGETEQTPEDTAIYFNVADLLGNDSDVDKATDGQSLSITGIAAAQHGTATLLTDGRIRFVPDSNFHGTAEFTYIVNDGNDASNNGSTTATVKVDVSAVNDDPVIQQDTASVDEDSAILFTQAQLLANDSDVDTATDGQVLTITAVSDATNGTVSMQANGDIRFIPNANYHGAASFICTVSDGNGGNTYASVNLTVLAVNDSPTALGDVFVTQEDSAIVLTSAQLLANDTDNDISTDSDVLTISRVFDALHCTATLNTDGTINLVPDAQYHGNVRFSYEITDTSGATSTAFVVAGVSAVNDAPVSQSDSFDGREDTLIILEQADVLANDTDNDVLTDGDSLSVQSVGNASHGTVRLLTSGQIEFLPEANYHGLATFDYMVTDTFGATSTNTVTLSIGAVNDTPVVQGESTDTSEDTTLSIDAATLLANDSDVDTATDGQVLSLSAVSSISGKTHGTVSLVTNVDGMQTVQFVPEVNYHGVASFNYTVSDGNGGYATAVATINIAAVNDAPFTVGEISSTDEDTAIFFTQAQLLDNDSDVDTATDGQVLTITAVSGATNGSVSMLASGDIRLIPNANYHGAASFTYTVSDGNGATTDASVRITVNAVNDTPVVQGESTSTKEDTTLYIAASKLLDNDNDSDVDTITDGQVLSLSAVSSISGQTHGTVSLVTNADGTQTVQFAPDANYHGVASFNYTVSDGSGGYATAVATINLAAVNDAPVTVGEISSTDEDVGLTFTQAKLLENDSDVDTATDGQVLTITAVSGATNGTVSMLANGDIRFIPSANYHGAASFTYTVSDGNGGTTDASVSITVNAVNDTPVVQGESTSTYEDTTLYIAASKLLANDSDVDTATDGQVLSLSAVSSISGQTHGTVSLVNNADGTQTVQFTPDANYQGVASFNYTVSDGSGGYATAVATINLAAVNDAPVTVGEISSTDEDSAIFFTQAQLLDNDSDVDTATDGQVLTITAVSGATNGTVSMLASGDIRFIPNANYHGAASFTYTVSDGNGGTTDASVSITVNAINDVPVVTGETVSTNEDTTLWFIPSDLLTNDTDVDVATDGQVLSITAVSNATHGTVGFVAQADGSRRIAFTPDANYFGVANFQYTVSDGAGGTSTGTVSINVAQINDVPVASNDSLSGATEDTALHISFASLLSNDTDADSTNALLGGTNDVLTVSAVGNATHGSVALVNGEVVFTPDANYHGVASFVYQVRDQSGTLSQATAAFTITAVNDAPVATGETISSSEDSNLLLNQSDLLKNDSDVDAATDGQVLTIKAVSNARHGSVTLNADGTILFVPDANYYGTASFDYTVDDGNGGTASATATITLLSVNDAPVAKGETVQGVEDQQLTILSSALLQNDTDVDNSQASLVISRVQSGAGGTAYLNASGHVVFTPNANYNGNATFTYWVKDPDGLESNAVTATVVVSAVNDAPTAQGEIVTGASEDAVFNINKSILLANDSDIDDANSALSLSWVGNASGGSVSLDGNGNVVFTPNANYNGNASFQYKVRDAAGAESAVVQAVIPVTAVNDAPVAVDDKFDTYKNTLMTVAFSQLTSNDSDVDGDSLTVSAVRDYANGHASIVDGQVQFQATTGFTGAASFDYLSDDGHGGKTWAVAYVNVAPPPNQYPTASYIAGLGHGYYPWMNWVQITFGIEDDTPQSAVAVRTQLMDATFHTPEGYDENEVPVGGWIDASYSYTTSRDGNRGNFIFHGFFDLLKTNWLLTDEDGLTNQWHFEVTKQELNGGHWGFYIDSYNQHSGYFIPPIVLDLNGDGIHFNSLQNSSVKIDVNSDGILDTMAWAGNDDGVLIWDKDQNHQISDASEFCFQTLKIDAQTDLEGLQTLDTNGNGLLDAGDDEFAEFAVWQDANDNGKTDANELKTLDEQNIVSINLKSDCQLRDAGTLLINSGSGESDAVVMGNAVFARADGSSGLVADAMLAYEQGRVEAIDARAAEFVRQALLFNQMCNTASSLGANALAYVPIENDWTVQDLLVSMYDSVHQSSQAT